METKKIPVFLASDDNYASFIATTVVSILENTNAFIEFYILDSGISEENKRRIAEANKRFKNFSIEYVEINIQELFGNFPLHVKEHTLNVFSRYLIPQIKPELKKVIYLDVDIIVKGDLGELYDISLDGYHLGAIPEYTDVLDAHKKELGIGESHGYFNAGILVIDCEYFRSNDLTTKLIEKTLEIRPKYQDQDIFNIVFQNNYKVLDYKFNVSWYMYEFNKKKFNEEVNSALAEPFIIHYSTFKPWKDLLVLFADDFWFYARKTSFYEVLLKNLIASQEKKRSEMTREIRIFNLFTILKIEERSQYCKINLFNSLPFLKIRRGDNQLDICFLSWKFIIFKIKTKNL